MFKINAELFIVRRISRVKEERKGTMIRMATISVAIGMAVMIVALAVISGFKREIVEKLEGFGSDIKIVSFYSSGSLEDTSVGLDDSLSGDILKIEGVKSVLPYITKSGIIRSSQAIHGTVLKGVSKEGDMSFFIDVLEEGTIPDMSNSMASREVMISRIMADMLDFGVGDKMDMLFIGNDGNVHRDMYRICGIYSTGMDDFDKVTAVTRIENLRRLNRWGDDVATGYEIKLDDMSLIDDVFVKVSDIVREYNFGVPDEEMLYAVSIKQEYMSIFDWLATLDVNGAVIIIIMIVVSLLNMVSALLIILLERTSMIGILKSLGMSNGALQRLFLMRAFNIIIRGMIYGNIVGVVIVFVQKFTGLVKLDASGYLLSRVPISFDWEWFLGLNVGVPVVLLILMMIPLAIVSFIKPDQTMRYQ